FGRESLHRRSWKRRVAREVCQSSCSGRRLGGEAKISLEYSALGNHCSLDYRRSDLVLFSSTSGKIDKCYTDYSRVANCSRAGCFGQKHRGSAVRQFEFGQGERIFLAGHSG